MPGPIQPSGTSSHASDATATADCDQLALFALSAILTERQNGRIQPRKTGEKPRGEAVVELNFFDQEVLVGTTRVHLYVPGTRPPLGKNLTDCAGGCGKILSTAPASRQHPLSFCETQIKINNMPRTLHYCEDCTEGLYQS